MKALRVSAKRARDLGIEVENLEDSQDLQDAVLTVHHACVQTLSSTPAFKLIENQNGVGFLQLLTPAVVAR